MIHGYKLFGFLAALCLLTVASCSKGGQEPLQQNNVSVRQIDITEMVPIHISSLDYFDFVIKYMDNTGLQQIDTVRDDSSLLGYCYVKSYVYTGCPVACTAIVELVPKVPGTELASFTFIRPKPYLIPTVRFSSMDIDGQGNVDSTRPEGYEDIPIASMQIDEFLSTYGTEFFSHCVVYEDYDGFRTASY